MCTNTMKWKGSPWTRNKTPLQNFNYTTNSLETTRREGDKLRGREGDRGRGRDGKERGRIGRKRQRRVEGGKGSGREAGRDVICRDS